jgi:rod shape-determining protein MreC
LEFFIKHKTSTAFIVFSLFSIISLSVQTTSFTKGVERVGSGIMQPFQHGYDGIKGGLSWLWTGYTELKNLEQDLLSAQKKLQKYESVQYKSLKEELKFVKNENIKFRKLIGIKAKFNYKTIYAKIISKDPDNWFKTLVINKGVDDGLQVNMPVIAFQGGHKAVVGKIVEIMGGISRIVPIISPDIKVGVFIKESKFPGLLYGYSSTSNLCIIDYVSRGAIVKFGDTIITSGHGGVFPYGIIIGKVFRSDILESSSYQRTIVKPIIDFNLLEDVFVVLKSADTDLQEVFEGDR